MTELERMQIEWECGRLIKAYCNHVDERNYEAFIALFTEDARWETQSGGYMQGHSEFRAYLERRSATSLVRHVSTNALVEAIDDTHARGQSYITLFRDSDYNGIGTSAQIAPVLVGEYHDTYIRKDGQWFFESRFTKIIFSANP
jgi:hypothetical protein